MSTQWEACIFLFCFFQIIYGRFVVFGTIASVISLGQKTEKGRLPICWLVFHQQRVKNHIEMRYIERGIDNPVALVL